MGKTTVVNKRVHDYDVFIGRPSKWGNPFRLSGESKRGETLDRYREYLLREIEMGRLDPHELRGKVLGCYCKPAPCHGDILAELADAE